jgi:hypothetical protein
LADRTCDRRNSLSLSLENAQNDGWGSVQKTIGSTDGRVAGKPQFAPQSEFGSIRLKAATVRRAS